MNLFHNDVWSREKHRDGCDDCESREGYQAESKIKQTKL